MVYDISTIMMSRTWLTSNYKRTGIFDKCEVFPTTMFMAPAPYVICYSSFIFERIIITLFFFQSNKWNPKVNSK